MFYLLLEAGKIQLELVEQIRRWKHSGFSVVAPAGWTLSSGGLLAVPEAMTLLLALVSLTLLPLLRRR